MCVCVCVCVCVQRLATYVGDYQHQDFKRRTDAAIRYGGPTVVVALLRRALAEYHASQASDSRSRSSSHSSDLDEIILSCLLAIREMAFSVRGLTMSSFAEAVPLAVECMCVPLFFEAGVTVCEELLSSKPEMPSAAEIRRVAHWQLVGTQAVSSSPR